MDGVKRSGSVSMEQIQAGSQRQIKHGDNTQLEDGEACRVAALQFTQAAAFTAPLFKHSRQASVQAPLHPGHKDPGTSNCDTKCPPLK